MTTTTALQGHLDSAVEQLETAGDLYEWLAGQLEIEITTACTGDGLTYRGAEVTITTGGPGIWLDTQARAIKGAWGGEAAEVHVDANICDQIDQMVYELIAEPQGIGY